jgi:hypothetical protein
VNIQVGFSLQAGHPMAAGKGVSLKYRTAEKGYPLKYRTAGKRDIPQKYWTAGKRDIPQNTRILLESFFGIPFSLPVTRLFCLSSDNLAMLSKAGNAILYDCLHSI